MLMASVTIGDLYAHRWLRCERSSVLVAGSIISALEYAVRWLVRVLFYLNNGLEHLHVVMQWKQSESNSERIMFHIFSSCGRAVALGKYFLWRMETFKTRRNERILQKIEYMVCLPSKKSKGRSEANNIKKERWELTQLPDETNMLPLLKLKACFSHSEYSGSWWIQMNLEVGFQVKTYSKIQNKRLNLEWLVRQVVKNHLIC